MKKTILALAVAGLATTAMITGCNSDSKTKVKNSEDKVADARETLERAENEYQADLEIYKREINARIDANEQLIDQLKAQKKYEKGETKEAYEARIDKLKQRNRDLKKKLNDYQARGNEDWQKFKEEFNHDMEEMGEAFKNIGKDNVK